MRHRLRHGPRRGVLLAPEAQRPHGCRLHHPPLDWHHFRANVEGNGRQASDHLHALRSTWLQVRQRRPDYVLLWGWGVMNSTAIKEAVAVAYPREKMYGVWWSGAEQDVRPAEGGAAGYNSAALQHTSGQFKLHEDLKKYLYDKGKGYQAQWAETGEILYVRGLINAMLGVEAIRTAQEKFGKKPLTGEQVRWGLENLNLTAERIKQLGFEGELRPIKVSCADHEGTRTGRIQPWDGEKWNIASNWLR